ncbi:CHAT domain-containing protein [Micromonospora sp. NPDC005087]|uniref:CHAT domain-containing protein n=1 Tax=Micromonospora sp. NPDC005087 TaxID=3364225 RepID=UPI0036AF9C85
MGDLRADFAERGAFFRDTSLPSAVLAKYRPGLFLREPTFCDASGRPGGFVAPHRYVIFSANARTLPLMPPGWGLCLWPRDRLFKIVDRVTDGVRTQITLLEVPDRHVAVFSGEEPNGIETAYAAHGRELFEQLRLAGVVPELDTDRWRERLVYPVGVDDEAGYFPLYKPAEYTDGAPLTQMAQAVQYQAKRLLEAGAFGDAQAQLRSSVEPLQPFASRLPEALTGLLAVRAELHTQLGDGNAAEADLHEAFRLCKQLNEDRLPVAAILSRLGHLYQSAGELDAAEKHYLHALAIKRRVAGDRSAEVVPTLVSVAVLHEQRGQYARAQELLDDARSITRELGRDDDPVMLNNLARLQQAHGRYDDAWENYRAALAATRPSAIGGHQHTALLGNLAELHAARGDAEKALRLLTEVLDRQREMFAELGAYGSQEQHVQLLRASRARVAQYVALVMSRFTSSPARVRRLADLVVDHKGLGIDSFARRREAAAADPDLRARLDRLAQLRGWVAEQQFAGPGQSNQAGFHEGLRRARQECEALEAELARNLPGFDTGRLGRRVDSAMVARVTPAGAASVELLRYGDFDFEAVRSRGEQQWRAARYLAVVLLPERPDEPVLVDLGVAAAVDELVAAVRAQATGRRDQPAGARQPITPQAAPRDASQRLRTVVFDPLRAAVGDTRRLLIAPDGDLLRLPFEMLATIDGRQVIDDYTISYLTATRDLLRLAAPARLASTPPLVVAGPDYDLGSPAALGKPLALLPAAVEEGERIGRLLGVRPRLAGEATKTAIRDAHAPVVLHIATHGFALKRQPPLGPHEVTVGMTTRLADPDQMSLVLNGVLATPGPFVAADDDFTRMAGSRLANPLLRSALAMAGANTWLGGGEPPDGAGNGILTALEVTGLDLDGTELVVLSACDTGLGEVEPGEGVFGLRRCFVLAGARTLVMSLWKVPDEQTAQLMADFYQLLRDGLPRAEALRQAQLRTRERHPDPRYWAAFVCQGDDGSLSI